MTLSPLEMIRQHARDGAALRERFFAQEANTIAIIALRMAYTLAKGNKLLFCGNGGSAADCQHLAAEFVNRFMLERPPLPAIALTTDTSAITAIANDYSFDLVFAKQVLALGNKNDILIAISTSGNSKNVNLALDAAHDRGIVCVGLSGKGGGKMAPLCDFLLNVDDDSTALIQEVHIAAGHLLCALTDHFLFESVSTLTPFLEGKVPLPERQWPKELE